VRTIGIKWIWLLGEDERKFGAATARYDVVTATALLTIVIISQNESDIIAQLSQH
jgi:hypothetical protein